MYNHSKKDFAEAIGVNSLFREKVETWMKEDFVDTHTNFDTMTETLEVFTNSVKPSTPGEWMFAGITFKTAQMSLLMAKEQQYKEMVDDPELQELIDDNLAPDKIAEYVDSEEEII